MTKLDFQIIEYLAGMLFFHDGFNNWHEFTFWEDQGYLDACTLTLTPNKGPYREPF